MVYVDSLKSCIPNKNWKYNESCHLFADSIEELHAFASRIGLRRSWFQNSSKLPHYDLTRARRIRAVKNGAIEVSNKFLVDFMWARKQSLAEQGQEEKNFAGL